MARNSEATLGAWAGLASSPNRLTEVVFDFVVVEDALQVSILRELDIKSNRAVRNGFLYLQIRVRSIANRPHEHNIFVIGTTPKSVCSISRAIGLAGLGLD
jgi:hypothetical protein